MTLICFVEGILLYSMIGYWPRPSGNVISNVADAHITFPKVLNLKIHMFSRVSEKGLEAYSGYLGKGEFFG